MEKEYRLILLAVLVNKTQLEELLIDNLLKNKLDWCEIAGQLFNHRLAGYFLLGLTKDQQKKFHENCEKQLNF